MHYTIYMPTYIQTYSAELTAAMLSRVGSLRTSAVRTSASHLRPSSRARPRTPPPAPSPLPHRVGRHHDQRVQRPAYGPARPGYFERSPSAAAGAGASRAPRPRRAVRMRYGLMTAMGAADVRAWADWSRRARFGLGLVS